MKSIKLLAMDVDGTMTDGKIYRGEGGEEMKAFHIKDGLGIVKAGRAGLVTAIITGKRSKIVEMRAKELHIPEVWQGIDYKDVVLRDLAKKYGCSLKEIAFIGDDENDLSAMRICGITACPADAAERVRQKADFCCRAAGGAGAVREFIEYLLEDDEW